ncbi:hypothetical protein DICVIV_00185 [Dictyocaulus viviparus]|uniref:Uncharacterized protein n=1 Tax=Dictyocaulus viviparus TaxID=29172 RepID=A0A0D8YGE7_DICVI|nr:hypothetical protein DICVIV_00185 [Dictyocaulus viviparus]
MYRSAESGDAKKISKRDMLSEAEAKLKALSLEPARPLMAQNVPVGTIGEQFPVQTNAFAVDLKDPMTFWRYSITISAEIKDKRTVYFTKKSNDDYLVTSRNFKCKVVFDAVLSKYKQFFGDSGQLWYDGQSILYSGSDLFKNEEKTAKKFEVSGHDCYEKSLSVFETIVFDIAPVEENYCITLTEKALIESSCNLDLSKNDHSLAQLMEIIFNQIAVMNPKEHVLFDNGKAFVTHPWLHGFNEGDCPDVGDGKRLHPGTQKSVYIIEGPKGRGSSIPAIFIDSHKAAFHEEMSLIEKAKIIVNSNLSKKLSKLDLEKLNSGLKGLYFYTKYAGFESDHKIAAVVDHTASDTT